MRFGAALGWLILRIICSTSNNNCPETIVDAIKSAKPQTEILVQAYLLTDQRIADALIDAKGNGVGVRVVLAKIMEEQGNCSVAKKLMDRGVEVLTNDEMKPTSKWVKVIVISKVPLLTARLTSLPFRRRLTLETYS